MPSPTPEAWAQIRYEYEQTDRPVVDICFEHGITANTLRHRGRKWGWKLRRAPIPAEGPPAFVPPVQPASPPHDAEATALPTLILAADSEPSPHIVSPATADALPIGQRLQGAVARVLPAIEMTLARLGAGPVQPREMELAARALGSLTRTLRELNGLLGQHPVKAADDDPPPEDMDEFRARLVERIQNAVASRNAQIPAKYEAAWNEFAVEAKHAAEPVL